MHFCNLLALWLDSHFKLYILRQNKSRQRNFFAVNDLELNRKYCLLNSNDNDKNWIYCQIVRYRDNISLLNIPYCFPFFWLSPNLSHDDISCYFVQIYFNQFHLRVFVYKFVYFVLFCFDSSLNRSIFSQIFNSILEDILYGYSSILKLLVVSNMNIFYQYQNG